MYGGNSSNVDDSLGGYGGLPWPSTSSPATIPLLPENGTATSGAFSAAGYPTSDYTGYSPYSTAPPTSYIRPDPVTTRFLSLISAGNDSRSSSLNSIGSIQTPPRSLPLIPVPDDPGPSPSGRPRSSHSHGTSRDRKRDKHQRKNSKHHKSRSSKDSHRSAPSSTDKRPRTSTPSERRTDSRSDSHRKDGSTSAQGWSTDHAQKEDTPSFDVGIKVTIGTTGRQSQLVDTASTALADSTALSDNPVTPGPPRSPSEKFAAYNMRKGPKTKPQPLLQGLTSVNQPTPAPALPLKSVSKLDKPQKPTKTKSIKSSSSTATKSIKSSSTASHRSNRSKASTSAPSAPLPRTMGHTPPKVPPVRKPETTRHQYHKASTSSSRHKKKEELRQRSKELKVELQRKLDLERKLKDKLLSLEIKRIEKEERTEFAQKDRSSGEGTSKEPISESSEGSGASSPTETYRIPGSPILEYEPLTPTGSPPPPDSPEDVESVKVRVPNENRDFAGSTHKACVALANMCAEDAVLQFMSTQKTSYDRKQDAHFYCVVCKALVRNTSSWEEHLSGDDHRRKLLIFREIHRVQEENRFSELALSQNVIDNCKQLVAGAEFVIEFANSKLQVVEQWACTLCSALCGTRNELLAHLSGIEHLANYVLGRAGPEDLNYRTDVDRWISDQEDWVQAVREAARTLVQGKGKGRIRSTEAPPIFVDLSESEELLELERAAVLERMEDLFESGSVESFVPKFTVSNGPVPLKSDEPLLGIRYGLKFRTNAPAAGCLFYCTLCKESFTDVPAHCAAPKHVFDYVKKHHTSVYSKVLQALSSSMEDVQTALQLMRTAVGRKERDCSISFEVNIEDGEEIFIPLSAEVLEAIVEESGVKMKNGRLRKPAENEKPQKARTAMPKPKELAISTSSAKKPKIKVLPPSPDKYPRTPVPLLSTMSFDLNQSNSSSPSLSMFVPPFTPRYAAPEAEMPRQSTPNSDSLLDAVPMDIESPTTSDSASDPKAGFDPKIDFDLMHGPKEKDDVSVLKVVSPKGSKTHKRKRSRTSKSERSEGSKRSKRHRERRSDSIEVASSDTGLKKLEKALQSVGVNLTQPLTWSQLSMLRGTLGSDVMENLMEIIGSHEEGESSRKKKGSRDSSPHGPETKGVKFVVSLPLECPTSDPGASTSYATLPPGSFGSPATSPSCDVKQLNPIAENDADTFLSLMRTMDPANHDQSRTLDQQASYMPDSLLAMPSLAFPGLNPEVWTGQSTQPAPSDLFSSCDLDMRAAIAANQPSQVSLLDLISRQQGAANSGALPPPPRQPLIPGFPGPPFFDPVMGSVAYGSSIQVPPSQSHNPLLGNSPMGPMGPSPQYSPGDISGAPNPGMLNPAAYGTPPAPNTTAYGTPATPLFRQ